MAEILSIDWLLAYVLLGAIVGFVAGLLGVGGGGIMVPVLTAMFIKQGVAVGQVVHLALGTSMACIVFTSIASLRAHQKKGAIIWRVANRMSIGVVVGTFAATFIAAQLNSSYLAIFFAVFMSFVAYRAFFKGGGEQEQSLPSTQHMVLSGSGIGAISALVSIGGGSLTVPYLSAKGVNIKKAIGTSSAVGLPIAIAGTLGYLLNGWQVEYTQPYVYGFVYLPAVVCIAIVSFFTAPIGAKVAHALPVATLKKIFAVLLALLSVKMLYSVS